MTLDSDDWQLPTFVHGVLLSIAPSSNNVEETEINWFIAPNLNPLSYKTELDGTLLQTVNILTPRPLRLTF